VFWIEVIGFCGRSPSLMEAILLPINLYRLAGLLRPTRPNQGCTG
jgi:hypothetical protein